MRLRRAIIFVEDVDRMTAFYRDALGLAELHREPGWVELDGVALHAIPAHVDVTVGPARTDTAIKLVFACDDLDTARAALQAAGAKMRAPWSANACDGVDPEGNVFQIVAGSRP